MGRPPRNSIGSTSSSIVGSNHLGSHPQEMNSNHRAWLARSLDKNDLELAALEKLNESLHALKKKIIERDGSEELILDVAVSISKLDNGLYSEDLIGSCIDESDELLQEFFLRMKLRRRLLNRFARRLNRVSRSMDGETVGVGPPPPPKYGDTSVEIEDKKVEQFVRNKKKFAEYNESKKSHQGLNEKKEIIKNKPENEKSSLDNSILDEKLCEETQENDVEKENSSILSSKKEFVEYDVYYELKDLSNHSQKLGTPDFEKNKYGIGIGGPLKSMSRKEKIEEHRRWENDLLTRIPDQPTFKQLGMNVIFNETERRKTIEQMKQMKHENESDMSDSEIKELEDETDTEQEESQTSTDKAEDESENDDESSVSDNEEVEKTSKQREENTKTSQFTPDSYEKNSDKKKSNAKGDEKNGIVNEKDTPPKSEPKIKDQAFFSLQATPSFYNQDIRRIRAVHAELMDSTKKAHIQQLLTEVTDGYNQTVRMSTELSNLRHKLQGDVARLLYSARNITHGKKRDHAVEVAIAKNKWQRRKDIWEQTQRKKLDMMNLLCAGRLKTRVVVEDIVSTLVERVRFHAEGRRFPNPMRIMGDPIRESVASILSDMKDTIVTHHTAENLTYDPNEKFENFIPPPEEEPRFEAELGIQYQLRVAQMKNEIAICDNKLAKSEEERKRAWKRMVKAKAEAGGRHSQVMDHLLPPVPALRGGKMYANPIYSDFNVTTNQSSMRRQMGGHTLKSGSHSRESRDGKSDTRPTKPLSDTIKARIFPDGSIKPVVAPKQLKDGTFQRPAGRKRKGMDWDSNRGVWTPSNTLAEKKNSND